MGYNWKEDSIEYVIGLKNEIIKNKNCTIQLPKNWLDNDILMIKNNRDGSLKYEMEMLF